MNRLFLLYICLLDSHRKYLKISNPITGDPTFYRWKDALSLDNGKFPTRKRGKSDSFLLGGIHLTYYTYVPYYILRVLSATECGKWNNATVYNLFRKNLRPARNKYSLEDFESHIQNRKQSEHLKLLSEIKEDLSDIIYLPWFYACNKYRYPSFIGKHDSRVT